MRMLVIAAAAFVGLAGLAAFTVLAQDDPAMNTAPMPEFAALDTDQSGTLSLDEVKAALPDLTDAAYAVADVDQNGELDEDEFAALAASPDGM